MMAYFHTMFVNFVKDFCYGVQLYTCPRLRIEAKRSRKGDKLQVMNSISSVQKMVYKNGADVGGNPSPSIIRWFVVVEVVPKTRHACKQLVDLTQLANLLTIWTGVPDLAISS